MKKETIQVVKDQLFHQENEPDHHWLSHLREDERKGVQQLLARFDQLQEKKLAKQKEFTDKRNEEIAMCGTWNLAGIDEVGRGPLAGPVTTAAVIIPEHVTFPGLTDSKQLSKKDRVRFYQEIMEQCDVGIGEASVEEIDHLNIYHATRLAMNRAVHQLKTTPVHLLVDAMTLTVNIKQTSLIKGDSRSVSIAAASVIAKETRDTYMHELHERYPVYGFDQHVGYGTAAHLEALDDYGPSPVHRKSFRPVSERLA